MAEQDTFTWKFHRIGGADQLTLRTADELCHLDELDPKLWVALSCPIAGLQFDKRTLELIDTDHDGRIRMQEIQDAVRWITARLKDPATLAEEHEIFQLSFLSEDDQGKRLAEAARRVLLALGKDENDGLQQADVAGAVLAAARTEFNGDGIMPDRAEYPDDIRQFIRDIMATCGSVTDASGEQGVDLALAQKFLGLIKSGLDWRQELDACVATLPAGVGTAANYALFEAVKGKIDDYFIRCRLVEFDGAATKHLNAAESTFAQLSGMRLDGALDVMTELPLALVDAGKALPLDSGLNPAWAGQIAAFRANVLTPLLGQSAALDSGSWEKVKAALAPLGGILARTPDATINALPAERITFLLESDIFQRFEALVAEDKAGADAVSLIGEVEKLVLFHKHLYRLLMNFVSFCDFYDPKRYTTFQFGTLYIDGRSCELCIRVDDINKHADLAQSSRLCLAYCSCERKDTGAKLNIAAAITTGGTTFLIPGRHGVFVDKNGQEWDATLVRLVDNATSIRSAMFSPYSKLVKLISGQIQKLTAARQASAAKSMETAVGKAAVPPAAAPAAAAGAKPFDIGRSMGIFAAIGLALGAIGTALASIAAAVLSLSWWQFPLLIFGIFICISGPAMFMAWLNLRQRTLGPVLDASGWAVNSKIPINIMMGRFLTASASLPKNSHRSLDDPFKEPSLWKGWMTAVLVLIILCALAAGAYYGWNRYQQAQAEESAAAQVAPAAEAAAPAEAASK